MLEACVAGREDLGAIDGAITPCDRSDAGVCPPIEELFVVIFGVLPHFEQSVAGLGFAYTSGGHVFTDGIHGMNAAGGEDAVFESVVADFFPVDAEAAAVEQQEPRMLGGQSIEPWVAGEWLPALGFAVFVDGRVHLIRNRVAM